MSEPATINGRLADLVKRAELSALAPSTNKRNRVLLKELCFALVSFAQLVASQQAEMAEKSRIVIP